MNPMIRIKNNEQEKMDNPIAIPQNGMFVREEMIDRGMVVARMGDSSEPVEASFQKYRDALAPRQQQRAGICPCLSAKVSEFFIFSPA